MTMLQPEPEKNSGWTIPVISAPEKNSRWTIPLISAIALGLTCLPYLAGYFAASGRHYLWLGGNIDDAAVYLAWMRQGESGSLRVFNRFTTDAQPGLFANPLFLFFGIFARITHLPLVAVYHLARLGFGAGLLALVWKFIRQIVIEPRARLLAFLFVCFASGVGWLPLGWENFPTRPTCPPGPLDLWQPEAITFLSLYLNPLFLCAMCLQVGVILLLLRGEQTGRIKYACFAGICGLALSLVHTYDIITLGTVWITYITVQVIVKIRNRLQSRNALPVSLIVQALIAGLITLPGFLLMVKEFNQNTIFRARANVETLTTYPQWVLLGYGLTLLLAVYALLRRGIPTTEFTEFDKEDIEQSKIQNPKSEIQNSAFLPVWAVMNCVVAYLPGIAFQRKLLQGEHFPIAILAGIGATLLITKYQPNADRKRFALAAGLLTFLLGLTNFQFLLNETQRFQNNETKTGLHRPSLLPGEVEALDWLAANTPPNATVQPLPWQTLLDNPQTGGRSRILTDMTLAVFTPAFANRAVYCGHFGETPDYGTRLSQIGSIALGITPDEKRIALLREMHVDYIIFSQKDPSDAAADILFPQFRGHFPLPAYLTLVHSNPDADLYAVHLP